VTIKSPRFVFSTLGISSAPQESGVLVLWDGDEVIYIGRTVGRFSTIKSVLTDHCAGFFGPCTAQATHYGFEVTQGAGLRERDLIEEFQEAHKRLPRCHSSGTA
jgi:hypothetical protein